MPKPDVIDYRAIEALDVVVEAGSFEKAAEVLHISASAVSQRIARLERKVCAKLVLRGTPCRATDEGMILIRHVHKVRLLEQQLAEVVPEVAPFVRRREVPSQK